MLDLIPTRYKWQIAIKKASYTMAKLAVAGVVAIGLGDKIDADRLKIFEETVGLLVAGGLELIHDWAKLKWPDKKWL